MQNTIIALKVRGGGGSLTQFNLGFTLAEVLITLGIIGIVAAMTIPALVSNYKKQIIVTRMEKFYSIFNQAIKLEIAKEGSNDFLENLAEDLTIEEWFNNHLKPHMKIIDTVKASDGILLAQPDGSGFGILGTHVYFCPEFNKCKKTLKNSGNSNRTLYTQKLDGKNIFAFRLDKKMGLSTYAVCWNGERSELINTNNPTCSYYDRNQYGCNGTKHKLCAKLIEFDGWQIKKDYPIKL